MPDISYRTFDVEVRGGPLRVGEWGRGSADSAGEVHSGRPARSDRAAPRDSTAEEGEVVLAVHGVTSSHLAWPFVARELLAGPGAASGGEASSGAPSASAPSGAAGRVARVLAPDLRGRGRSNALPGPYGMAQHADDLAAVLRAAGVDAGRPAVVVGHSMGAFAALVLADRHRELVDRLVLVDGGFPLELPPGLGRDEAAQALLGPVLARLGMEFESPEAYVDSWRGHPAFAHAWAPEVEDYARYDLDGEAPHLHPATVPAAIPDGNVDLYSGKVLVGALDRLSTPAVFLRAERGFFDDPARLYPDEAIARWHGAYPAIEVRDVPGTNHYTIVMTSDGAAAVARAVLEPPARHGGRLVVSAQPGGKEPDTPQ
ncbi:alpha/beta fold hydrolase [Sinomonas sp. P10A9]|uniref:Alpha/beta fold hydrolase n=1 Tax=Sinomonas puerhi TaxID=3238584 RepID=A0AB39KZA1_9MICC